MKLYTTSAQLRISPGLRMIQPVIVSKPKRRLTQVVASRRRSSVPTGLRYEFGRTHIAYRLIRLISHPATAFGTPLLMSSVAEGFLPIAGLSADSSNVDICRAVLDLHTLHAHRKHFCSDGWRKLYRCVVHFSSDREYGSGHLATAYLHYRVRTLYRLCGEGAPHPDEKQDKSQERKKASKRRHEQVHQQHDQSRDGAISGAADSSTTPVACPSRQRQGPSSSVVGFASLSRFHDAHPDTQCLASLFRRYTQKCGLLHGADFDIGDLPEKRARKRPTHTLGATPVPQPDPSVPGAVSPGYAECTRKAFDKVCEWLCEEAPPDLRMDAESVFLDIGCGTGKCVVQARLRAGVRKSIGIEYVPVRYLMGFRMLTECIPAQFASLHTRLDGRVELLQGDATSPQFREQYELATHIFAFDWVFNDAGKRGVLGCVEQSSSACVFISCQRLDHVPHFRKVHQMQLSTGVQHPTIYFYARLRPSLGSGTDERLPEQRCRRNRRSRRRD